MRRNGHDKMPSRSFLVVDDQDPFRDEIAALLREAGHEVVSTAGLSAISERGSVASFDYAVLNLELIDGGLAGIVTPSRPARRLTRSTPGGAAASLAEVEWAHVQRVMKRCGGNISEAARQLGIARRTLQLKLKKAGRER